MGIFNVSKWKFRTIGWKNMIKCKNVDIRGDRSIPPNHPLPIRHYCRNDKTTDTRTFRFIALEATQTAPLAETVGQK